MVKKRATRQDPAKPSEPAPRKRQTKTTAASAPAKPAAKAKAVRRAPAARKRPAPRPRQRAADALDVVMVAPEMHPFATSGGLSEVARALPEALGRLGHTVTVIIPRYRRVVLSPAIAQETPTPHRADPGADASANIDFDGRRFVVSYFRRPINERVTAVFVDVPELFDRDGLYGDADGDFPDNALRFAVFARAAIEYIRQAGKRPSVIHAHDWQTGLVPVYQKMHFSLDPIVGGVPVVFTIHNLAFQGIFPAETLDEIDLPRDVLHVEAMEYYGRISYLKAGINFSERITTVSPTYAAEILRPQHGFGFEGVLARRATDLRGILNGIDVERWNPQADRFLPAGYDAENLAGKKEAKRLLLQTADLDASGAALARPVIGLVSRLTDQKGFDLIAAAAGDLMTLDATWVMLGSGERKYEELWRALAARFPGRVSATIGYDERLEHLITAGADAFLMPSNFEPCGLNQLNCLRYGTLPIVRTTGGLNDTVHEASAGRPGTGFRFSGYTAEELVDTARRALETWKMPKIWREMQRAAMAGDFSWDVSAREYVKVYRVNS